MVLSLENIARLSTLIICFYCFLDSVNLFFNLKYFKNNQVYSDEIIIQNHLIRSNKYLKMNSFIFKFNFFLSILLLRSLISIIVILNFFPSIIVIVFFSQLYLYYRNFILNNAAEKFAITILFGLAVFWISDSYNIKIFSIVFIGISSILSFFYAGIHKINSIQWRNGTGIRGLFRTERHTNKVFIFISNNKYLCIVVSWVVIIFQLSVLFVVLNREYMFFFLISSFIFHLFNYIFLKIKNFLIVYLSTFPCVYFTSLFIINLINK